MTETTQSRLAEMVARQPAMQKALDLANMDALLEHARMGRSVPQSRDGQIVTVTPAEIFARYDLDEFGRPKPPAAAGG